MATQIRLTVKGLKQGLFKGDSKDGINVLGFRDGVVQPVESNGLPSGKRQHNPVVFTKMWSASSPQFFQALVTNEQLSEALFEFLRPGPDGTEHTFYTIKLTNATVRGIQQFAGNLDIVAPGGQELEEISLTFQKIEVSDVEGKTTAGDDWSARI